MSFKFNPARLLAALGAALTLAVGFGLKISGEQINLIMVFASAVIALGTGEAIRSQVVPVQVADKQIEIAKAAHPDTPTEDIIREAKETA